MGGVNTLFWHDIYFCIDSPGVPALLLTDSFRRFLSRSSARPNAQGRCLRPCNFSRRIELACERALLGSSAGKRVSDSASRSHARSTLVSRLPKWKSHVPSSVYCTDAFSGGFLSPL